MITFDHYQQAVIHEMLYGNTNLMVTAVAGSGKTATLVSGTHELVDEAKMSPWEMQFTCFGKKDQAELQSRLPDGVLVNTVHSLCLRAMKATFTRVNLDVKGDKMRALTRKVFGEVEAQMARSAGYRMSLWPFSRAISGVVRWAKSTLDRTEVTLRSRLRLAVPDVRAPIDVLLYATQRLLEVSLNDTSQVDFDDLIYLCAVHDVYPINNPALVCIDEAQDISYGQLHFLMKYAQAGARILCVGDPKQAIFQFRGADEDSMEKIAQAIRPTELPMSVTYRCSQSVVDYVRRVTQSEFEPRPGADVGSVQSCSEGRLRAESRIGDFVISRNNAALFETAIALLEQGKPIVLSGIDIGRELQELCKTVKLNPSALRADAIRQIDAFCDEQGKAFAGLTGFGPEEMEAAADSLKSTLDQCKALRAIVNSTTSVGAAFEMLKKLDKETARPEEVITCSTVHGSKGRERGRVWLLAETFDALAVRGAEDALPSREDVNLLYVASSRAKHDLFIAGGDAG